MPDLSRLGARFDYEMRTLDGRRFRGRFVKVPEGNPTSITPMKRMLRVAQVNYLKAGDIVVDHDGLLYMLATNTTGMVGQAIVKRTFRCVLADKRFSWEHPTPSIDPVTKLPRGTGTTDMGMIWCSMEPQAERLERSSRTAGAYEKWKLITNAPLARDDLIDGRLKVERAEVVAGLTVADLQ